jgi:hypothetical protein
LTSHRPPVLIAAAAAGILGALYFVPNASATGEHPAKAPASVTSTATTQQSATAGGPELADTGSVDTTPYVIGGIASLGIGAALVLNASRRARYED